MEQQIKMIDKKNSLISFDFDQREQQFQVEIQSKNEQIGALNKKQNKLELRTLILKKNYQELEFYKIKIKLLQLQQSKQEQQHLNEMLKKSKEETEQLHISLEEIRKEQQNKKQQQEESRKSALKQQDLQILMESFQKDNLNLQQKDNALQNDSNRKQRELIEKKDEYLNIKKIYDETLQNLERLEKRWGDKIDQHRRT